MNKIKIALSADFTGETGLYSSVEPILDSINLIKKLCAKVGLQDVEIGPETHCTVIYAKEANAKVEDVLKFSRNEYKATIKCFTAWIGHNDKMYLVLELESPELVTEHQRLRRCGCKPTFEDYHPHITLKKDADYKTEAEAKQKLTPANIAISKMSNLTITLNMQRVENIREG